MIFDRPTPGALVKKPLSFGVGRPVFLALGMLTVILVLVGLLVWGGLLGYWRCIGDLLMSSQLLSMMY